ncbi:MAG: ATP-binding protein, partial [Cyanobacteriota bacterium]
MRLLSVSLRHVRQHRQLDLRFDPRLTLIGGANESGKS